MADPADPPKATLKGLGKQSGASGTQIYSGIITAEEYNKNLTGKQAIKTYEIMRRSDSTVHRTLLVCKLPIIGGVWNVEPASDDDADVEKAEFVKRELMERNLMWADVVRQALSMLEFGHSLAEKTYELTTFNGQMRFGIKSLCFLKQNSIQKWQTIDQQPGVTQLISTGERSGEVSIIRDKLIVFTNDKEGDNYDGISLLRYAYKDWDMKDKLILVNAVALEKMSIGIPVISFESGTDENEKNVARDLLRQMRANEEAYLEIPKNSTVDMLDMKANSTKDVLPTIQYHDRQIVASVLAQFLELGSTSGSGSRALSEDQTRLFEKSLEAVSEVIKNVFQSELIQQLCDLNFTDMSSGYPKLTIGKLGDDNITEMSAAVNQLVTVSALTPTYDTEQAIRSTMKLPQLTDDYKELYEKKRDLALNPPTPAATPEPGVDPNKDPSLKPEDKTKKANPDDIKASAIVAESKQRRQILVKMLDED